MAKKRICLRQGFDRITTISILVSRRRLGGLDSSVIFCKRCLQYHLTNKLT